MFPAQYYSQTENTGAKKKKKKQHDKIEGEEKNTEGHGGIVQVRQEGEKGAEIRVAWQK